MKKIHFIIFINLLLILLINSCSGKIVDTDFIAQETFFSFYPADQYLQIIEYNIVTESIEDIENKITNFQERIEQSKYSSTKFNFENFIPIEESITNEGAFVKGSYHLVSGENNALLLLQETFESILSRDVDIEFKDNKINISFDIEGLSIGSNNALDAFTNDERVLLLWDNKVTNFELVFQRKIDNTTPLTQYITDNINSPELSQIEIDEIKNSSPELSEDLQGFQDDADIYRLRHLKYYGELIEEYKATTGKYPFQHIAKVPLYVFIAHDKQIENTKQENPNPHEIITFEELIKEIEDKLGRKIDQFFDPQYVPVNKPNYYMYMIRNNQYFFAVHVSKYYEFSTKIADNYYKVEVSNFPIENTNIQIPRELFTNVGFLSETEKKVQKEGIFIDREQKYINYIK